MITVSVSLDTTFWDFDLPSAAEGNGIYEGTLLRSFGDQGCIPRLEIRSSPYGESMKVFRASYSDHVCKEGPFDDILKSIKAGDSDVGEKLWRQLKDDISYIFKVPLDGITDDVEVEMEYFENGWYYVYSNTTLSAREIKEWAAAPLGDSVPICLAHEAWDYKNLGWAEASMRTAQQCIERLIPKSSELLECWMYELFPPCASAPEDEDDDCYSQCPRNSDKDGPDCDSVLPEVPDILGSETKIPSPYCNERWWVNKFKETESCEDGVTLTSQIYEDCLARG